MTHLLEVRKRVFEELNTTRVIKLLAAGTPDRDAYVLYLISAYGYAQHSPKVMALAAARCMATHPELATYLLRHAEEEQGHEQWALQDLRELNVSSAEVAAARPVPACESMIGYMHYVAGYANPVGLFGWMYVLEAVGNDLGTLVAERLKRVFQGAAVGARFVGRHGASDKDHAKELADQIDRHVRTDEDVADVNRVADVVADLYVRMFREVGQEQQRWE